MTSSQRTANSQRSTISWRNRIIGGLVFLAALVIAYFILAAFIPRWWAQQVGQMVNGSFAKGIGWGLVFGGLCTAVPLFLLLFAALMWRRRGGKVIAGGASVLAVVCAIPNLMTLAVVLGGGNAAHAGERIMDVDAPAFRGASLVGALLAVLVFAAATFLVVRRRWRGHRQAGRPVPETTETAAPKPSDL
ncbi:permease [Nocardia donostiensis]|uniref:Permease n=1 Tax=Nocardia donostiensis TaxID=1538463 RepID=A0A1W0B9D9_9NOCA|nr:permease [Nocardia donostiensis]ONM46881.1 permease [Nocardia donostiensis]OQS13230.1 permease [Nocardia donostiensis]OQS19140.1 permease [Nocardia donostiensis]